MRNLLIGLGMVCATTTLKAEQLDNATICLKVLVAGCEATGHWNNGYRCFDAGNKVILDSPLEACDLDEVLYQGCMEARDRGRGKTDGYDCFRSATNTAFELTGVKKYEHANESVAPPQVLITMVGIASRTMPSAGRTAELQVLARSPLGV